MVDIWRLTGLISCFFGIIFCYRASKKYKDTGFPGRHLYAVAWMLFSMLIPVLNIIVSCYYSIVLFDNRK